MGIARNLERRLERLADGLSAAVFRGKMHPVDLANRLIRQADLMVTDTGSGPQIPNQFTVAVNSHDLDAALDTHRLERELTHALAATAAERGWRIAGPIDVAVAGGDSVGRGSIKCTATAAPGPLPAWGELAEHRGNRHFSLVDNRNLIGRADDCDIVLAEPEVSRHHAVVFREGGSLWVADLHSANGTTVNGKAVNTEPLEIGSGDMLSFGPATFALRVL
jgi:hypothetical protein